MPSPHVDDEKGKKAMVYKARKDRRKVDREKRKTKDSTFLKGPFGWKSGKVGGWKIVGGWKCGKMENI